MSTAEEKRFQEWLIRDKYNGNKATDITVDLERLAAGEPLDYVIGWREFAGCHIDLSEHPLIPRPETEFWVQPAIEAITKNDKRKTITCLDLCAGSGCIGVAVAKATQAQVDFVDQEGNCLTQIQKNIRLNNISSDRVEIIKSDLFAHLVGWKYDFILTNPPYIPDGRILPKEVGQWEPVTALRGGEDGLDLIRRILAGAKHHLNPGGQLWLEFDTKQAADIKNLAHAAGFTECQLWRDQYDRYRWLTAQTLQFLS